MNYTCCYVTVHPGRPKTEIIQMPFYCFHFYCLDFDSLYNYYFHKYLPGLALTSNIKPHNPPPEGRLCGACKTIMIFIFRLIPILQVQWPMAPPLNFSCFSNTWQDILQPSKIR